MAQRNGTYIAFHANGQTEPTESDFKYYALLKAWSVRTDDDFSFVDSHEKTSALRDRSSRSTVERRLRERLDLSKNMILILGATTHEDTDFVPLEIRYAVDDCRIPIIAAYTQYTVVAAPYELSGLWPRALWDRINSGSAHVLHVPFKKEPLRDAVPRFDFSNYPIGGGLGVYGMDAYRGWGLA